MMPMMAQHMNADSYSKLYRWLLSMCRMTKMKLIIVHMCTAVLHQKYHSFCSRNTQLKSIKSVLSPAIKLCSPTCIRCCLADHHSR